MRSLLRGLLGTALLLLPACDAGQSGADYVKTGIAAKKAAASMSLSIGIKGKVRSFQVKHGRNPESLDELEESEGALPTLPAGKVYELDPVKGTLRLVDAQPAE